MTWSCSELFTQEMAAACLQAEAAVRAGEAQAAAAHAAGLMTLGAGVLALFSAGVAAIVGYVSVNKQISAANQAVQDQIKATNQAVEDQIKAAQRLQTEAQRNVVKTAVYRDAVTGLYQAMLVIARMADVRFTPDDALKAYQAETSKAAQIHMVAPLDVLEDVLKAIEQVSAAYLELSVEHQKLQKRNMLDPGKWGVLCMEKILSLTESIAKASVSMRNDIDIPIDRQAYEALVQDIVKRSDIRATKALAEVRALYGDISPIHKRFP